MKIKLKQLRPNPFRNLARYPISRAKVEMLKASIRTTGFWDNLLVRRTHIRTVETVGVLEPVDSYTNYELAYGHHRLEALNELKREQLIDEDYELELPVRNLDDAAMVRIMAAENMKEFATTCDVIDETVEATRAFIMRETRTSAADITAPDIAQFLGSGWNEDLVWSSLQRLKLFDQGVIDRERLAGLTPTAGRTIQREVSKVMRTNARAELEEAAKTDADLTEHDRQEIRDRVQTIGRHVGEVLVDHLRNGGSAGLLKEVSIEAQIEHQDEQKPPDDERKLSTIDAAARAIHARDFQRKIEMLLKYKSHMSPGAKHELAGTLREVLGWLKQQLEGLEE